MRRYIEPRAHQKSEPGTAACARPEGEERKEQPYYYTIPAYYFRDSDFGGRVPLSGRAYAPEGSQELLAVITSRGAHARRKMEKGGHRVCGAGYIGEFLNAAGPRARY